MELRCADIYDWDLPHQLGKFDAGYFSGSISLMPDPLAALKVMAEMLKPGGVSGWGRQPKAVAARLCSAALSFFFAFPKGESTPVDRVTPMVRS